MKLQGKIWLGSVAVIATIMAIDLYTSFRSIENEIRLGLDHEARTVRAVLMATRRVYHEQFLSSGIPVNERTVGFLPAHAMSRISAQFPKWFESGLRFNNVSDRPRNPANQADADELAAMDWFRKNPRAAERISEIRDERGRDFYFFTTPIWIEAYCLRCHGPREDAPESIRAQYSAAYGYRLGDLRGLMSIKVPLDELRDRAMSNFYQRYGTRAVGYGVLLLALGLMIHWLVLRPIGHLQRVTIRLGAGDRAARAGLTGDDELAGLATSFNGMADAICAHEAQVERLNQAYSALSETNQAIVRDTDEAELFRRVCQIAVERGGMVMAWIGRIEDQRYIVPHESFGNGLAYLSGLSIDSASPTDARGPSATAWRTNRPVIVQDFFADERTRPWHERARPFAWGSMAAFPIVRQKTVGYLLNLYHAERYAFDSRLRDLLGEMADDIGFALDRIDLVAEQGRTSARLMASEAKYRNVLATSQDGFWLVDFDGVLIEVNDAYCAFSGYTRAELLAMRIDQLEANEDQAAVKRHVTSIVEDGHAVFETRHRTRSGEIKPVEISVSVVSSMDRTMSVFIRDLSTRQEAEQHIQRLAHFDILTGLPNRALFVELATQAIGQAARNHEHLVLVYIDIDHFRNVNETLGHRVGDQLLIQLAERFKQLLRSEDILSRQGGDEFLLLLPHADAENAAKVAERMLAMTGTAITVSGHELLVTPSIGLALYPADGTDFETLLQKADTAVNQAKTEGRNAYRFFEPEMQRRSARSLRLEAALHRALDLDQLILHYQPQVELHSGRIVGLEALIRWNHPELGLISPAEFIPIAENSGLILPIGEWVIRMALLELKRLLSAGFAIDQVAVNLSVVQFRQSDLPERIARLLAEVALPASRLELELTESLAMENPSAAIAMMDALHQQGIRLSIDDFGSGYSSLSYLRRFRIDKLKIDQSFVRDLEGDAHGGAIVEAIVDLANTLKFRSIAEGVETAEQLRFLRQVGCHEVQGYYFSRPLPPDQLAAWLVDWQPFVIDDKVFPVNPKGEHHEQHDSSRPAG